MSHVRLFTPGPTPVPEEVLKAGAQSMIHHRSEEFAEIIKSVRESLKRFSDCDGESVLLASSGTGGMEAAVSSLLAAGDEVVIVEGGKFGERWVELAAHYELKAQVIHVPWGKSVRPEDVLAVVSSKTRAVLMQACESSTGAYHPVGEIGRGLSSHPDVLLIVDAITALGIHDLSMVRDRIDILLCGSQKAFMCPPGVAMVMVGKRALDRLANVKPRSFYFSLQREVKAQVRGQTAFTPAISLIRSLRAAMDRIEAEGKERLFARQKVLQAEARRAFREFGLELFNSDADATLGITVAKAPEGMNVKSWLKELKTRHNLWLAGGQGELEGKIFRISHMGFCSLEGLKDALKTIRESL